MVVAFRRHTRLLFDDGLEAVEAAVREALLAGTSSADVIVNILAGRLEAPRPLTIFTPEDLALRHPPRADCDRYDSLRRLQAASVRYRMSAARVPAKELDALVLDGTPINRGTGKFATHRFVPGRPAQRRAGRWTGHQQAPLGSAITTNVARVAARGHHSTQSTW